MQINQQRQEINQIYATIQFFFYKRTTETYSPVFKNLHWVYWSFRLHQAHQNEDFQLSAGKQMEEKTGKQGKILTQKVFFIQ